MPQTSNHTVFNFTYIYIHTVYEYVSPSPWLSYLGVSLKKEMNQCNAFVVDLPAGNNLGKTLQQYKQRFEEFHTEYLGYGYLSIFSH